MTDTVDTRRYAHQVVPEPGEGATLEELARYHLARAQGFHAGLDDLGMLTSTIAVLVPEAQLAFLYDQLAVNADSDDPNAQTAVDSARRMADGDEIGEWLWTRLTDRGIDPDSIRPYRVRGGQS